MKAKIVAFLAIVMSYPLVDQARAWAGNAWT